MATIKTAIALEDNFSSILNNIVNAVNMTVSVMDEMHASVGAPFETGVFEGLYAYANQASLAVQELDAALQNITPPELPAPALPQAEPVEISFEWRSDNRNVFTAAGVERFTQEVQSANYMLNTLYNTQAQVAAAAGNLDVFSDNAVTDLGNMQNRLQGIWQQVYQISSNPLNFGSDMANAEIERLRWQLDQAVQQQERLNAAVADMDVQAANEAYLQLSEVVGSIEGYIRDNTDEQGNFNDAVEEGVDSAGNLHDVISGAVRAFLGVMTVRKAFDFFEDCIQSFDTQLNAETQLMSVLANMLDDDYVAQFAIETNADMNSLNLLPGNIGEMVIPVSAESRALDAAFTQITDKAAEIQSRGIYGDETMIAAAAEFSTYFSDPDAVNMMLDTLANYSMGMENGVSEVDTATMVNYATNLGKITGGAYDAMSEKGFVFSDVQRDIIDGTATQAQIVAQLGAEYVDMSEDMQAAAAITQVIDEYWAGLYETMSATPEGRIVQMLHTWGDMQEVIGGQLYPYVLLFVDTINANWPTIASIVQGITTGLQFMLGVLNGVLQVAIAVAGGVADNWSLLAPIVYGVAGALAVYGAALMINKASVMANNIQEGIAAVVNYAHADATDTVARANYAAAAAQYGFNAAVLSCPIFWIVAGIVALVAVFYLAIAAINHFAGTSISATGIIAGVFATLGAHLINHFVVPLWNAFASIANFIGNVLNDPVAAIKVLFYDMCLTVIGYFANLAQAIESVINKIPGVTVDITSGLDSFYSQLENAQQKVKDEAGWVEYVAKMDYIDYGSAWNAGYSFGEDIANFNPASLFGVGDIPSPEDYVNGLVGSEIGSGINDIANSAGAMRNSLDLTDEDLQYLRDIAEREAINRFTTAEIVVDMGGITNQINKLDDLDGIVTRILDGVNEAVEIAAEGVHI